MWRSVPQLHHRSPHLPVPRPPTPHIAALGPDAWAETVPQEVAHYLWRACLLLAERKALAPQRAPLQAHLPLFTAEAPSRPQQSGHQTVGPREPLHLHQGLRDMPQRGALLARQRPVTVKGATADQLAPDARKTKWEKQAEGCTNRPQPRHAASHIAI